MKTILIISILISLNVTFAQYTEKDFEFENHGIGENYFQYILQEKSSLKNAFNNLQVSELIKPIKVKFISEKGEGVIFIEINYDHKEIMSKSPELTMHEDSWNVRGKGITVYLFYQICQAVGAFKYALASKIRSNIEFEIGIKLIKKNGDYVIFSGYNLMDRGLLNSRFRNYIFAKIGKKSFELELAITRIFNESHFLPYEHFSIELSGKDNISLFRKFFEEDSK